MKLILISDPDTIDNEHAIIHALFKAGLSNYHLRKPEYTEDEMQDCIEKIDVRFRKNVVLHTHHQLCQKYSLKGVHYNKRAPYVPVSEIRNLHQSIAVHSLKELAGLKGPFNYVLLSPIFESISKPGYHAGFENEEVKKVLNELKNEKSLSVIALGGIDESKIEKAREMGFAGVAVMGALWSVCKGLENGVDEALKKFDRLNRLVNNERG